MTKPAAKNPVLLSDACNASVVIAPGRRFPGMILQGDTMRSLYDLAHRQCQLLKNSGQEEAYDIALQLEDDLGVRLEFYERILREHGLGIPYPTSVNEARLAENVSRDPD